MAYVEFLAKENEIYELLEKGHTMKHAHEILMDKGIISMSYPSFFRHVTNKKNKKMQIELNKQQGPKQEKSENIVMNKINNLALKSKKEEAATSLGLLAIDKNENFFNQDKDN